VQGRIRTALTFLMFVDNEQCEITAYFVCFVNNCYCCIQPVDLSLCVCVLTTRIGLPTFLCKEINSLGKSPHPKKAPRYPCQTIHLRHLPCQKFLHQKWQQSITAHGLFIIMFNHEWIVVRLRTEPWMCAHAAW